MLYIKPINEAGIIFNSTYTVSSTVILEMVEIDTLEFQVIFDLVEFNSMDSI